MRLQPIRISSWDILFILRPVPCFITRRICGIWRLHSSHRSRRKRRRRKCRRTWILQVEIQRRAVQILEVQMQRRVVRIPEVQMQRRVVLVPEMHRKLQSLNVQTQLRTGVIRRQQKKLLRRNLLLQKNRLRQRLQSIFRRRLRISRPLVICTMHRNRWNPYLSGMLPIFFTITFSSAMPSIWAVRTAGIQNRWTFII